MSKARDLAEAKAENAEVKSWTCKSCDKMVEQEGVYCAGCQAYWHDVSGGLFDDHY